MYLTVGLSHGKPDKAQVELLLYSPRQDDGLVRILLAASCHHRFSESLGLHHTVNFGLPWLNGSACMHGYLQLPYLDGPELELFECEHGHAHLLWLIPITADEKNFAVEKGWEALEERFEQKSFNYLDPLRAAVVPSS
ncbi:MAG: suppressor of fused domain protein [Flavobacteriales bacterium]|nr:suppressor of fused domain protein [Flavobacteriales bacterium]